LTFINPETIPIYIQIIVTGCVRDVRPYISMAQIYVIPLHVGGGTTLKALKAMAMKKSVVSTIDTISTTVVDLLRHAVARIS